MLRRRFLGAFVGIFAYLAGRHYSAAALPPQATLKSMSINVDPLTRDMLAQALADFRAEFKAPVRAVLMSSKTASCFRQIQTTDAEQAADLRFPYSFELDGLSCTVYLGREPHLTLYA